MPIKINAAGVIPVIFASSVLSIPGILAQVFKNSGFTLFVQKYLSYTTPVGFVIYVLLIFFFSYFYTFIELKPEDFAKNLQENGGYIPGIRPGEETKKYLSGILFSSFTNSVLYIFLLKIEIIDLIQVNL